ncbi:MAG TPA: formate dehydrogenase accessory sulfurtransferase FdhD [Acidothermaceae bacterium]|nr:formate dehydrogenase accessory sulfurtransferase FdhD [Acidothermaceae bacterium]
MGRITGRRKVRHIDGERQLERVETLAAEEPLEIRVDGEAIAVTMRTPGDDFDLVAGFALSEGLVSRPAELAALRYCAGATAEGVNTYNVVDIVLSDDAARPARSVSRNFYTTSSCGVCGKASIDAVRVNSSFDLSSDDVVVGPGLLAVLPARLRSAQKVFDSTGGLHAAGLFDSAGQLLALREDVGRHNAVDKVVGWALRENRLPLAGSVLMVSGRASFELVQKAYLAGIPILAAVSAPSTLAVEFAESVGMTLVGFLRGASMNVYTGAARVGDRVTG